MCYKCPPKNKVNIFVLTEKAKVWKEDKYGRPVLQHKGSLEKKKGKALYLKLLEKATEDEVVSMEILKVTKQFFQEHGKKPVPAKLPEGKEPRRPTHRAEKRLEKEIAVMSAKLERMKAGKPPKNRRGSPKLP